jgi:membrane protease subunit HflK
MNIGKFTKIIWGVFILVVLITAVIKSVYFVDETQTAVVCTFGVPQEVSTKGLHFCIPGAQKVTKVDTTVRTITIGYYDANSNVYQSQDYTALASMITNDLNFVDVDYAISYYVSDPIKYLYNSSEPDDLIANIAVEAIRSVVSAYTVDAVITTGKNEIQMNIKNMIVDRLEKEDLGLSLSDASMQDAEPPEAVSDAFKEVETAKQQKETLINEANKYRNEQLPAAQAEADSILQDAEAQKTSRINEATGEVASLNAEYEEYIKYPLITKQRMFYETMEEILPDLKVIIDTGTGIEKYYPIEQFATTSVYTGSN